MAKLFGTDGIRGIANKELTAELAFKMARVVAYLLRPSAGSKRAFFVLGRDTRLSGDMLESALVAGINSAGVDVRLLGVISTPAVAYLTRELNACGGIMVSASHNPMEDNGIKFFNSEGLKLSQEMEDEAERLYLAPTVGLPSPTGGGIGCCIRYEKAANYYLSYLQDFAPNLEGVNIVLDCAHGSLWKLAPRCFRELGAEVSTINTSPNGKNINDKCGSTHPEKLQKVVVEKGADIGLAYDGDGDRLIAVDEQGDIVDGDAVMGICASHMKEKGELRGDMVVATVMSNGGLDLLGEQKGFNVLRTKVGDRYVWEEMLRGGYSLGGEQSGHIIFLDYLPTGDGLLTSLQLLKVIIERKSSLSKLNSNMQRLPQILVNCHVQEKNNWETNPRILNALNQAEERLGSRGRVVLRASGTEPLIRIMLEGEDNYLLHEISQELVQVVEGELGKK